MEHVKDNIFRQRKPNGKFRYYVELQCSCGQYYFTDKYNQIVCCSDCRNKMVIAGRPLGHKLSGMSKEKISKSRTGKHHNSEVRKQISNSVKQAFKDGIYDINQIKGINHQWYKCGKDHPNYKHGHSSLNSSEYRKFRGICQRCYNENNKVYRYYGAKGIKVCDLWLNDFTKFLEFLQRNGFSKGKHLHRIDPNGDYGPDNVIILDHSTHSRLHGIMRAYRRECKTNS